MSSKPKNLQAIRDYLVTLTDKTPVSISPTTLAARLGTEEKESTALLEHLRIHEEMLTSKAFIRCANCNETYTLEGNSLQEYREKAAEIAGSGCKYCDCDLDDEDFIEIRLSYFCQGGMETNSPNSILPNTETRYGSPLTINDMKLIETRVKSLEVKSLEQEVKKQLPRWMIVTGWGVSAVAIPLLALYANNLKSCSSTPDDNENPKTVEPSTQPGS